MSKWTFFFIHDVYLPQQKRWAEAVKVDDYSINNGFVWLQDDEVDNVRVPLANIISFHRDDG